MSAPLDPAPLLLRFDDPLPAGAAYRSQGGSVLVAGPAPRSLATYGRPSAAEPEVRRAIGDHELLALGLLPEDVEELGRHWGDDLVHPPLLDKKREQRRALVQARAALRARERAALLRDMRRGRPPPGSCCLAWSRVRGRPRPITCWPDRKVWWGERRSDGPIPWEISPSGFPLPPGPILRVLALHLTAEQCAEAAQQETAEALIEHLRRRGLA